VRLFLAANRFTLSAGKSAQIMWLQFLPTLLSRLWDVIFVLNR